MKKILVIFMISIFAFTLTACKSDDVIDEPIECGTNQIEEEGVCVDIVIEEPLTVAEALLTDDLTYVEVKAFVIGYDAGKRHVIIEDADGVAAIQMFSSLGFPFVNVGDEVLVKGYRTYDRSTNRLDPETLEILSSGNPTSKDNPTVIDYEDLNDWTIENRMNEDALFRWYTFVNVPIVSKSDTYSYIDDSYEDELDGRGLKIAVKNTSFYSPDNLIEGATYTITALVYGSSDDFFDESLDGTVLRLTVLSGDDIVLFGEEAIINLNVKSSYIVGETEPTWIEEIDIIDPVDGDIIVTEEMVTEDVDMSTPGVYSLNIEFTNSQGYLNTYSIEVTVLNQASSVTEAINAEEGTAMLVEGVVIGYGYSSDTKKPIIIEDPANGNAIELWGNSDYDDIEVGDLIVVYTEATKLEKGQPRLDNHELIMIKSSGNPLFAPTVIDDLSVFLTDLETSGDVIFGRYTFTAIMEDSTSSDSYKYFSVCEAEELCLQFAVHNYSLIEYSWVEGNTYTVTGLIYGVSDPIDVLQEVDNTKTPTIRFGIMDEADIQALESSVTYDNRTILLVGETEPSWLNDITVVDTVDGEIVITEAMITEDVDMSVAGIYTVDVTYENSEGNTFMNIFEINVLAQANSVSEAIDAPVGTEMLVEGVVIGYGYSSDTKKPIIIEDPANGNAIEIWGNSDYDAIEVGDLIVVYTEATKLEKDQPRLDKHELISIVSSGNALTAPVVIDDLETFLDLLETSGDVIFGRYTFTATMVDSTSSDSYKYFSLCDEGEYCLQFAVHSYSLIEYSWIEGNTYTVTGLIYGVSDPIDVLQEVDNTKTPTIRFGIMDEADIQALESSVSYDNRTLLLVGETEPSWINDITVTDTVDGVIVVTEDMITEDIDMSVVGAYTVNVSYVNSEGQPFINTFEINVVALSSVTEAIDAAVGTEMYVEGVVIGYGYSSDTKKPIIIEDPINGNAIEFWGNSDYDAIEVGDFIVVYTEATKLEKGQPRLDGHELISIVSSGNTLSEAVNIDDMETFLASLEAGEQVIFGRYTFTATMVDATSSNDYKYFSVCDEGEYCLKFSVHKDSFVSYTWVEGNTYTVTGIIYGVSDPIDVLDEVDNTKSPSIRFGIMDVNDIIALESSVSYDNRTLLLVGETEPTWINDITVTDTIDGEIVVTEEMITEDIDMSVAGTYTVNVSYENSEGQPFINIFEINVVESSSVTEAIDAAVGTEMYVEGVVIGYGYSSDTKKPIIIEDPLNGNAIEIWGNSDYDDIEVGDLIVVYTEATKLEKDQPRLDGHELISIVSSGNALTAPVEIDDLETFLDLLETSGDVIFGRYTFTATMVDSTSSSTYKYFSLCDEGEYCLQFAVHSYSLIEYSWVEGNTYTVTGLIYGVSDPIDVLQEVDNTKTPTIRFGIMDINDIQVLEASASYDDRTSLFIGETEPTWIDGLSYTDPTDGVITVLEAMISEDVDLSVEGTYNVTISYENSDGHTLSDSIEITVSQASSVTEAIDAAVGTEMYVEGVVIGYGYSSDTKKPIIIEDPANGNAIEFWGNSDYDDIEVGDLIIVYTEATKLEKGQPRLDGHELISIVSSSNALTAPTVINDLEAFLDLLETSGDVIFGRYTFTATMVDSTSSSTYKYFSLCDEGEYCLQFAVHNYSLVEYSWVEGNTYTVTGLIYGVSNPIDVLQEVDNTTSPTIRFGIMYIDDIEEDME